jgi:Flp pilus assembly pilin Flp
MVEYGLMVALIAVVAVAGVSVLGTELKNHFTEVKNCIAAPSTTTCS